MIDGKVIEAANLTGLNGIRHGFFTRQGGVSTGDYKALNVGLGSDDRRDNVLENRRRVAAHLRATAAGQPLCDVATNHQVHSARAVIVEALPAPDNRPEADALVTRTPGLAVGALTADCTPVLFADPEAGVVAAAHAGWRGAVSGILKSTIDAMVEIGAARQRICAAIGPTIQQANYEVGPEFKAQFIAQAPGNARYFVIPAGQGRNHFDLPGYCFDQLQGLGLASVHNIGLCTYGDESLFFSYRRKTHRKEGDYGRQIAAIVVT